MVTRKASYGFVFITVQFWTIFSVDDRRKTYQKLIMVDRSKQNENTTAVEKILLRFG